MIDFKMKKIPTMFVRDNKFRATPVLASSCEWVLRDEGIITIKIDGINVKIEKPHDSNEMKLFRRIKGYDEANGYNYVPCSKDDPSDKWLWEAYDNLKYKSEGYYEAYGPNIQGNPHKADKPSLIKIGPIDAELIVARSTTRIKRGGGVRVEEFFSTIKDELAESPEIEGLVFVVETSGIKPVKWAKIKRKDFGFRWPIEDK